MIKGRSVVGGVFIANLELGLLHDSRKKIIITIFIKRPYETFCYDMLFAYDLSCQS